MPNKMNYIPVPETMKGQLEPQGTIEIDYTLVNEGGVDYIKVTSVEGEAVAEYKSPEAKMKRKFGLEEDMEEEMMM